MADEPLNEENLAEKINGIADVILNEDDKDTFPIQSDPKPVYMRKRGAPVEIGQAIVTRHAHHTDIRISLDTDNGNEFGSMAVTNMLTAIYIGGALNPDLAAALKAKGK